MAISRRSSSTAGNGTSTDLTIDTPAGVADGDILIAIVTTTSAAVGTISAPGWTSVNQADFVNGPWAGSTAVLWKRASGEGADHLFSWDGSSTWRYGAIVAYSGCVASGNPIDAAGLTQSDGWNEHFTAPSVTTTESDDMLLMLVASVNQITPTAVPAGMTEVLEFAGIYLAEESRPTAGATGTRLAECTAGANQTHVAYAVALLAAGDGPPPIPARPEPVPQLWVKSITPSGIGHELGDDIEGLSWSNVNPGGDERATFVYKRPWGTVLPEIARGTLLQIGCGLDVLWQGRIEEHDRGGETAEEIAVTAYGLGIRLKDNTFSEVYRDADLSHWGDASRGWRLAILGLGWNVNGFTVEPDDADGLPALTLDGSGRWPSAVFCSAVYDAGDDCLLGYVKYDWEASRHTSEGLTAATWTGYILGADDDRINNPVSGTDQLTGGSSGSATETAPQGKRVAVAQLSYIGAATTDGSSRSWTLTNLAVYGDHGLAEQAHGGFTVDQLVSDIVGRVEGIAARRIDSQSFEVMQAEFREPTKHEDAISTLNAYEGCDWGTWGPDSPLELSTDGQFDFADRDPSTQHWFALREEFANLDLHSETSTLFDTVKVRYTDVSGKAQTVTRTAAVAELDEAELSPRTLMVDAGTMVEGAAQTLGDTFLALSGGFAPARGSATIERPIRHVDRGYLPPCYLRADGSNLRISDILPTTTLFDLSSAPDRRTTFPIKRVSVDTGGGKISASVELDQSNDLLDVLQARLGLVSEVVT